MTIEIREVSGCKRLLVAELPAETMDSEIDRLARKYATDAKVPGFRPGKVPLTVVKQRFRSELRHDAAHDIVERTWTEALKERGINPITQPSVDELKTDPGTPVSFTLSFEVMPEFELGTYAGVTVNVPEDKIADEDVEKALEALRDHSAQYVPIEEGEVHDGHMLTLNIKRELDGSGKVTEDDDAVLVIGDGNTNEEFGKNLVGAKAGETRSFDVTYPADPERKRPNPRTIHYTVTVKEIKEKSVPELTDDFAKELGAAGVDELRTRVREDLITRAGKVAEKKAREAVLEEVARTHTFDVPESMVDDELASQLRRMAVTLAQQGIDVTKTPIDWGGIRDQERPNAAKAVRNSIVLAAIARKENLEISETELEEQLNKIAEGTSKPAAVLRAELEKEGRIDYIKDQMLQDKALDFIYRNANITRG